MPKFKSQIQDKNGYEMLTFFICFPLIRPLFSFFVLDFYVGQEETADWNMHVRETLFGLSRLAFAAEPNLT